MAPTLPVDAIQAPFQAALERGHVVVQAATGSGKSTRLPVWAAARGRTLVVEPRRVACTALAEYVAQLEGTELGERVGYAIRLDHRYSEATEVLFATPGVALRWLGDCEDDTFHTVILDEFHERRWDTDLLLALLRERARHRLVITSATLAAEALADYLGAERLEAEGRSPPVAGKHLAEDPRAMPSTKHLDRRVAQGVRTALAESDGDVLVFLPGRGEIRQAHEALTGLDAEIVHLHASAPSAEQHRALTPAAHRRVILATNVAETSLTVPGVTAVVDTGLERRTHQRNARTVLALAAISQANAEQRRGRAGRTAPGLCLKLWGQNAPLSAVTPPEVAREELTELVLAAACAGHPAPTLSFPDALADKPLQQALDRLRAMAAIDDRGRATAHGRALFALPIDALFAHLITAMPDAATRGAMADLAAALSSRGHLYRTPEKAEARQALDEWQPVECDATTLIAVLRGKPPRSLSVDTKARGEARRLAERIRSALGLGGMPETLDFDRAALLTAALRAAPDRAFVRREKRRHAMGNGHSEVLIDERSRMSERWEAALVLDEHSVPGKGTRETVTQATCLAPAELSVLVAAGLGEAQLGEVNLLDGEVTVRHQRLYANRVIDSREETPEGEAARAALAELILDGYLLAPAGTTLADDIAAWALYIALGHARGNAPDPHQWLSARLEELGVAHPEDIELVEPDDLKFPGVPEHERADFDRKYPRHLSMRDLEMRVHYEVRRKTVRLEKLEGRRKSDPKSWELPAWPGWKVEFQAASRIIDVRS